MNESKRVYHEDNFAKSPELTMVFPTVQNYNKESYALDMLGELISSGKKAPLYKVIVEEKKLAPSLYGYQSSREITGTFEIAVRAFPNINLSEVEKAIHEAFKKFEEEKFTDRDLARIKAKTETAFYNAISSLLGKSMQLASYNEFAGSPDFVSEDLKNILNVSKEDVWNVYNKYIKEKNYILTSFVPKGKTELIAENSVLFPIVEENISKKEETGASETADVKVDKIAIFIRSFN